MPHTEPLTPMETTPETNEERQAETVETVETVETIIEEMPVARRDYSKHFNRFAPEIMNPTGVSRKKGLLWGTILLLIGVFFLQTAFTGAFGLVGIIIYALSGVITSVAGIFRLISGIRGKAGNPQQGR